MRCISQIMLIGTRIVADHLPPVSSDGAHAPVKGLDAERSAVMDTLPERGGIDGDCKDHFGVRFHFLASFVRAASGSSVATKVQTSWGPCGPHSPKEIDLTSFCLAASRS